MSDDNNDIQTAGGDDLAPPNPQQSSPAGDPADHHEPGADHAHVDVPFAIDNVGDDVDSVHLVGDFNDWSTSATPMDRVGDRFEAIVSLVPGRTYQYRYVLDAGTDRERWDNDGNAEDYEPNEHGSENCVKTVPSDD